MSVRKVSLVCGEYYHVYNRGNSKQTIFLDVHDYKRFQMCLYIANGFNAFVFRDAKKDDVFDFVRDAQLVAIGAYCLMPNHFHILLTPLVDGGIQKFMQKITTSYSMYFNKRHERTGSLFEGRFRSEHADSDEYLKYLFSYIHLNPIKLIEPNWKEAGVADTFKTFNYLKGYSYSSFPDYIGPAYVNRVEKKILKYEAFPKYFTDNNEIEKEMSEWIQYKQE